MAKVGARKKSIENLKTERFVVTLSPKTVEKAGGREKVYEILTAQFKEYDWT